MDTGTFCSFYFLDSERDHDNGGGLKPAMTFVLLRVPFFLFFLLFEHGVRLDPDSLQPCSRVHHCRASACQY